MNTIQVTDLAATRINALRENAFGLSTIQKDNLLTAMTSTIRLADFMKEDEDLSAWVQDIENIRNVLCDYWDIRSDIEAI